MKNLILILSLSFFTLQCASNKDPERARIEAEYKIPNLSTKEASDIAYDFALFIDEIKKSVQKGDTLDANFIQSKANELLMKNKTKGESLSPADTKKLTDWSMNILVILTKELLQN